jgi:hypothetical protein
MDKDTRNAIERATQEIRRLLEEDFAAQLEGDFDVHRRGSVSANAGSHLTRRQMFQRDCVVAAIEHKRTAGMSVASAISDYLRDTAFTTLNRFAALKMLEARELVQECITKGEQSAGYREFCGMASGLPLLPNSEGYRLYIECLFDELSTEVKVLFDRRDPSSVLWPKRAAFEQILEILNRHDLADIWGEDETIGWVYQYFNGQDERRRMRDESQAPRNSRELAVRNQFFTPRYVVQFLVDNTLGRIWYEMRGKHTGLAGQCLYLVRKHGEEFAVRPKKDPRDLRVLDPACGSGHFLLYAFDLLLTIYHEAHSDPASPISESTGRTLAEDYQSVDALRKAIPSLILEHNLHGVDIDARCAQIAQLALWMRVQRCHRDWGISRSERQQIRRSKIVIAEPLAADDQLANQFVGRLDDPELGRVFVELLPSLRLAGELGVLLRVETLAHRLSKNGETGNLFDPAEDLIRSALARFVAEEGARTATKRWLFADDASQAIGLLGIVERRFDVVLMNPPFGDSALNSKQIINSWYAEGAGDLGAVFVQRGLELLEPTGRLGAITNRTLLAVQGFADWRSKVLDEGLHVLVDLGHGVLDAMVETAMYVCGGARDDEKNSAAFIGLLESGTKQADLESYLQSGSLQWRSPDEFAAVVGSPWAYWVPSSLLRRFLTNNTFLNAGGLVSPGNQTGDDFRFYRLRWEVAAATIHILPAAEDHGFLQHRWSPLAKGGEYSLWWDDLYLLQDWARDGIQIRNFVDASGKLRSRPQNLDKMFRRGATFPYRTTSAFGLRLLPSGASSSVGGWAVFAPPHWTDEEVLAAYNTRVARYFMEVLLGQGDSSASGTAARNHVAAAVGGIPWPTSRIQDAIPNVQRLIDKAALETVDETALFFSGSRVFSDKAGSFDDMLIVWWNNQCDSWLETAEIYDAVEKLVIKAFELSEADSASVADGEGPPLTAYASRNVSTAEVSSIFRSSVEELTMRAKEVCGAKRYTVKKAYFVDRAVDLGCHILRVDPRSLLEAARLAGPAACGAAQQFGSSMLSWLLGCAVGRFRPVSGRSIEGPSSRDALPQRAIEEGDCELDAWVDDPGHPLDIVSLVRSAAEDRWGESGDSILNDAAVAAYGRTDIRSWYQQRFFGYHISAYSKSRRKAPIYWQIGTASGSYSIWLAYHRLSADSFYKVVNDIVTPKLLHEQQKLASLIQSATDRQSAAQRSAIAKLEEFIDELRVLREETARIAPLWNPNLDDGVVINFALLWRLVPQHKAWQKEVKATWDSLREGEYDWACLAMHLWPERVVAKCASDRSLAIAHGLEEVFWITGDNGKWSARATPTRNIDELIAERTSSAVKAALTTVLEVSPNAANGSHSRAGRRRPTTVDEREH